MNVSATGSAGIYPITNAITNYMKNKGESAESVLTPQVVQNLQNLELHLRGRTVNKREQFDTVDISGAVRADHMGSLFAEESLNLLGWIRLKVDTARLSTTFTDERISERAVALSWIMDESMPLHLISDGPVSAITDEQLAQHFGKIGKRIDECFAAGEITQQEYDDLNAGLEKYTEAMTVKLEEHRAESRFRETMADDIQSMRENGISDLNIEAFVKERLADFRQHIDEFIKKWSCGIDRGWLAQMVQRARGGEDLVSGSLIR